MKAIISIQKATIAARKRLGESDPSRGLVSVAIENGKGQIRRVFMQGKTSRFDALSEWIDIDQIVGKLESIS